MLSEKINKGEENRACDSSGRASRCEVMDSNTSIAKKNTTEIIKLLAKCWRLTPVILATQKAEIMRIVVRSQPRQIAHETLSRKTLHKKGLAEWFKW
jgi:hypothetical protein